MESQFRHNLANKTTYVDILNHEINSMTPNYGRLIEGFFKAKEHMQIADNICNEWKLGEPSRNAHWSILGSSVSVAIHLGKTDTFQIAISEIVGIIGAAGYRLLSDSTKTSHYGHSRTYGKMGLSGDLSISFIPSSDPEAMCQRVKLHDHGPEFGIKCGDKLLSPEDIKTSE